MNRLHIIEVYIAAMKSRIANCPRHFSSPRDWAKNKHTERTQIELDFGGNSPPADLKPDFGESIGIRWEL